MNIMFQLPSLAQPGPGARADTGAIPLPGLTPLLLAAECCMAVVGLAGGPPLRHVPDQRVKCCRPLAMLLAVSIVNTFNATDIHPPSGTMDIQALKVS